MENVIVAVAVLIAAVVVGRMIYAGMTGKKGSSCGGCCDHSDRDAGECDGKDAQP